MTLKYAGVWRCFCWIKRFHLEVRDLRQLDGWWVCLFAEYSDTDKNLVLVLMSYRLLTVYREQSELKQYNHVKTTNKNKLQINTVESKLKYEILHCGILSWMEHSVKEHMRQSTYESDPTDNWARQLHLSDLLFICSLSEKSAICPLRT